MGKFHDSIKPVHQAFIAKQHLFFVCTAPLSAEGHLNVSPKGMDSFRVLSETQVGYMDLIGTVATKPLRTCSKTGASPLCSALLKGYLTS